MEEIMTLNIGKKGVSEQVVSEIKSLIKKRGKVRVKFLKAARASRDRKALAAELSEKVSARIVFARGNVLVLERR